MATTPIVDRAAYKAALLEKYPATIGTKVAAELCGIHEQTFRYLEKQNKLPFKRSCIGVFHKYLTIDVVNALFGEFPPASAPAPKRGRPIGSKNKGAHHG